MIYFNDVFDALCKLAADTELSVKNGAELLDRLVKDIVSESAATYASIIVPVQTVDPSDDGQQQTAFSLPKFIPLLEERIHVLNPFTRTFLVSWITLLDSIPDLELVAYLPNFLGGLLRFLSDSNQDVHTTTKVALDRFLTEIKKISNVKKGIAEREVRGREERGRRRESKASEGDPESEIAVARSPERMHDEKESIDPHTPENGPVDNETGDGDAILDGKSSLRSAEGHDSNDDADDALAEGPLEGPAEDEWIPGQDVHIDYQRILDILITFLSSASKSGEEEEAVQLTTLRWIESFMEICPEDILASTPRLLAHVLPTLSDDVDRVKQAAERVNQALREYVISLPEEPRPAEAQSNAVAPAPGTTGSNAQAGRNLNGIDKQQTTMSIPSRQAQLRKAPSPEPMNASSQSPVPTGQADYSGEDSASPARPHTDLDYEAAVNALTLQFLHAHEATRVAALQWLIMLHRKSPRRILAIQDATFPALLKTLSDPAEAVVTRDLLLLSQISKSSDDSFFAGFMINLLKLFATDRRLLSTRGNLIIRQLCLSLSAEKIYRTMASCLEQNTTASPTFDNLDPNLEFTSTIVQTLNNNLITAPELSPLRSRLRNLSTTEGTTLFTILFRAWSTNAVATFSLCLLAQAYEQAYHLLQIFASELEMTVEMLIQIDKLVQLLESPVFTYLRMQLLEPDRYPFLYKCLYGVLMLLPQSSAFAALKNRLGSVSAIGYLHMPRNISGSSAPSMSGQSTVSGQTQSTVSTFERTNRLKSRDDTGIKWGELLEKFRATQEKVRRSQIRALGGDIDEDNSPRSSLDGRAKGFAAPEISLRMDAGPPLILPSSSSVRPKSVASLERPGSVGETREGKEPILGQSPNKDKARSGLSHLGRLATGRKKDKK